MATDHHGARPADEGARPAGPVPVPVPVTVLGGYLGAGKTTRLNRLLQAPGGRRIGVLINDFGAINIDEALIEGGDDGVLGLANGCVCCTIADDLGSALDVLAARVPALDHVVIEASGVADPARISAYAKTWPGYRLAATVVVLDVTRAAILLADRYVGGTVRRQLASADRVVLSHADDDRAADGVTRGLLAELLPRTPVIESGDDVADLILGDAGNGGVDRAAGRELPATAGVAVHRAVTVVMERPLDADALAAFLSHPPAWLARLKGWLQVDSAPGETRDLQLAGDHVSLTPRTDARPGRPCTVLVAVWAAPDVDEVRVRSLLESLAADAAP